MEWFILTKPNPPKDGDGKPRVLAFFEKPWNDPSKDPKIAKLPNVVTILMREQRFSLEITSNSD